MKKVRDGKYLKNYELSYENKAGRLKTYEIVSRKELEDVETAYQDITGQEMTRFYRPPQGKYSESNLKIAKGLVAKKEHHSNLPPKLKNNRKSASLRNILHLKDADHCLIMRLYAQA